MKAFRLFLVDLVMEVESDGQLTQAESDEGGTGKMTSTR